MSPRRLSREEERREWKTAWVFSVALLALYLMDVAILQRQSLATLLVRVGWVLELGLYTWVLVRVDGRGLRRLKEAHTVLTGGFLLALTCLTGGSDSPYMALVPSVPLMTALNHPQEVRLAILCGVTCALGALGITLADGHALNAVAWAGTVGAATFFGVYGSEQVRKAQVAEHEARRGARAPRVDGEAGEGRALPGAVGEAGHGGAAGGQRDARNQQPAGLRALQPGLPAHRGAGAAASGGGAAGVPGGLRRDALGGGADPPDCLGFEGLLEDGRGGAERVRAGGRGDGRGEAGGGAAQERGGSEGGDAGGAAGGVRHEAEAGAGDSQPAGERGGRAGGGEGEGRGGEGDGGGAGGAG